MNVLILWLFQIFRKLLSVATNSSSVQKRRGGIKSKEFMGWILRGEKHLQSCNYVQASPDILRKL
jgi:hypothetical protein